MKKVSLLIILIFVSAINFVNAQEEYEVTTVTHFMQESKFEIIARAGIGYGIMSNDVEPNYNLNADKGEILVNYKFWKKLGVATGIGYSELSGNGFSSEGNFYNKRSMLKIPLLLNIDNHLGEKFRMPFTFGVYAQNIVKDEYRFLSTNTDDVYKGWNFGAQVGLSIIYQVYNDLGIGIHFNYQSDFSELENNHQIVKDKQKIENLNTVGLMVIFGL